MVFLYSGETLHLHVDGDAGCIELVVSEVCFLWTGDASMGGLSWKCQGSEIG